MKWALYAILAIIAIAIIVFVVLRMDRKLTTHGKPDSAPMAAARGGVESCPDTFVNPPTDTSGVQTLTFEVQLDSRADEPGSLDLSYAPSGGGTLLNSPPSHAPFAKGDSVCSFQVKTTGRPGTVHITASRQGCLRRPKTDLTIH
jgi:hypothetical protein